MNNMQKPVKKNTRKKIVKAAPVDPISKATGAIQKVAEGVKELVEIVLPFFGDSKKKGK